MKLFFKHLLKSTKKRPLQPLILLVTLVLSVTVMCSVLTLHSAISDERYLMEEARLGRAEIEISLSSSSDSRFMFAEDAVRIVGENAKVSGYYEVILSVGEEGIVSAAAVDYDTVSDIFDIEFTEYIGLEENDRGISAFISADFAEENQLSAGDRFGATLLGREVEYIVSGIARREFIKRFDVLLDITGVVKILASESPFAAALGDSFRPCNTILIDLADGDDIEEAVRALSNDPAFEGRNIRDVSVKGYGKGNRDMISAIIRFAIVLSSIMTAVVAYSSFSILASERREENNSFILAGARPSFMCFVQYAEAAVYWLIGAPLGLLLTLPALRFIKEYAGFKYSKVNLTLQNALISTAFMLIAVLCSASVFVLLGKNKKPFVIKGVAALVFAAVAAIMYLLTFAVPLSAKLIVGMISAIVLLLLIFCSAALLFRFILGVVNGKRDKDLINSGKIPGTSYHYSLKNLHNLPVMHGIVRMLSLLVGAFLCISYTVNSLNGNLYLLENLFESEHIILNGTERCYERVLECESVDRAHRLYYAEAEYDNGIRTNLLSVSDIDAFSETLKVTHQPEGREAVISYIEAKAMSLEVGDSFVIKQNSTEIELRVAEIVRTGMVFVLFDCESFGIDYSMLLPEAKAGYSSSEQLSEISARTADEAAAIIGSDKLADMVTESTLIYINSGNLLLGAITVFSLIGIFNTFLECYRSRKEEFAMYYSAGMSKSGIRRLKLSEILTAVGFSLIFGVLGFLVIMPVINQTMTANSYDAYENFVAWLVSLAA